MLGEAYRGAGWQIAWRNEQVTGVVETPITTCYADPRLLSAGSSAWSMVRVASRIPVWMIRANQTTLLDTAGVLDATALASILRGAEILLVVPVRVRQQREDQACKCTHNSQDVFRDPHSVPTPTQTFASRSHESASARPRGRPQTAHARERHKTRPNTARPTASAGTKVTTRLPSGVNHDTAPAVTKAAIRAHAVATRRNFGCERSP